MIQIGRYQLDEEEMVLIGDGQRVLLEPKVFEVLTYFCQNHNRYISMTELHETIWQGRCVSDAAVRRIISKIRLLVNDDHKNPTYIQSLPKRGYKLICAIEYNVSLSETVANEPEIETKLSDDVADNAAASVAEPLTNSDGASCQKNQDVPIHNSPQTGVGSAKKTWLKPVWLFFGVLLIGLLAFAATILLSPTSVTTQVVSTLPGDKIAVTQSADGQYLAFSGQVNEESGFQIYVKHNSDFDFKPITQQAHLPGALAFSADNQFLYFSDSTQNNSSLYRINILDETSKVELIAEGYYLISDVFSARVSGDIFFAAKETVNSPFLIYQYDKAHEKITTITSSSQVESLDIKGDISFDGEKLAVLRANRLSHSDELRIIDLKSNEVVKRKQIPGGVFDVAWKDSDHLLVLRRKELIKTNINSSGKTEVFSLNKELINLDSNSGRIVSINLGLKQKLFIEKILPFSDLETKRILTKDIYQMRYFGDKTLALLKENGVTQLGFIGEGSDQFDSILATEHKLRVLDVAISNNQILVKVNRRFALFDPKNIGLEYITSGDDIVGDAAFSNDGSEVLFTTKNYEQWRASSFDIKSKAVKPLIVQARYVRPFGKDYIIGNTEGEMFFFDAESHQKIALNQKLSKEPNTQWIVRDNFIYWSSHDLVHTTFYQLDISDIENPNLSQQQFKYTQVGPDFSIDATNEYFLMSQTKNMSSDVLEVLIE